MLDARHDPVEIHSAEAALARTHEHVVHAGDTDTSEPPTCSLPMWRRVAALCRRIRQRAGGHVVETGGRRMADSPRNSKGHGGSSPDGIESANAC
jgi:hypothetical protein